LESAIDAAAPGEDKRGPDAGKPELGLEQAMAASATTTTSALERAILKTLWVLP